jgi:ATP-dependent protease Clp ATPase subunit
MISLIQFQEELKKSVKGQDQAIDVITVSIYKWLLKLSSRDSFGPLNEASSLLIHGNSGCGKTYIMKEAAKLVNAPFIEINAKSINQEGWKGASLFDLIMQGIKELQPQYKNPIVGGIFFIDEFDKILCPNTGSNGEDHNIAIQISILKYLEGFKTAGFNFSNCLFVFAGTFTSLLKKEIKTNMGFNEHKSKVKETQLILKTELSKSGILPELLGRIQEYCKLNDITKKVIMEILLSQNFIFYRYLQILNNFNIEHKLTANAVYKKIESLDLGVRSLIQIIETEVTKIMIKEKKYIDLSLLDVKV